MEKYKIVGKGSLHGKEYGEIKIDGEEMIPETKIVYDKVEDQYCVDGQWQIPFHKVGEMEEKLEDIKTLKQYFVEKQMYEISSLLRETEKLIIKYKKG